MRKNLFFLALATLLFGFPACRKATQPTDGDGTPQPTQLCSKMGSRSWTLPCDQSVSLTVPECFELEILQGIDSYVGKLSNSEIDLDITYDIGNLAGFYVRADSPSRKVAQSVNQEFWYETRDGFLYFTFPNAGPANFYVAGTTYKDELIAIMKTVEVH